MKQQPKQDAPKQLENWILRGDAWDGAIYNYFKGIEKCVRFSKAINERRLQINDDAISYRVINHWETVGILDTNRPSGTGWRRYSFMDLVWIRIIKELRQFGVGIELIKKVRTNLGLWKERLEVESEFPILELYIHRAIFKKQAFLLVFPNGEAEPAFLSEYATAMQLKTISNCIAIDLNQITRELLPKADLTPEQESFIVLEKEEMDILLDLKLSNAQEIRITRNNGKIERVDITENVSPKQNRLRDVLMSGEFQTIELEQDNGKIVSIKRKTKRKYTQQKKHKNK